MPEQPDRLDRIEAALETLTDDTATLTGNVDRLARIVGEQSRDIARFFTEFSEHLRKGH